MNILFLSPTPPDHLHRIRALQIIKALSRRHRVSVLTFVRDQADLDKCDSLRDLCASVHTVALSKPRALMNCLLALPTWLPLRVAYQRSPAMHAKIAQLLDAEKFDLVYIKRKRLAQYFESITHIPRVLDLTDAVALYYERSLETVNWLHYLVHLEEYVKIRRYEPRMVPLFDRTVVCSPVDAEYLEQQAGRSFENLRVIPNVVDTDFYHRTALTSADCDDDAEGPMLLFSGLMDKHVNIDAAQYLVNDIFPIIRRAHPTARLFIAGPRPAPEVRAMVRLDGVTVTGYVDDLRACIDQATLVLCPVRVGAGTRNKILQAMSMQRAVVSTPLGAEGLTYEDGSDLLIGADAESFARATIELLEDRTRRNTIAERGRALVERGYSVNLLGDQFQALFDEMGLAG